MAATSPPPWTPPPTQSNPWSAGRVIALVLGIVLLLPGLGLLAGGGLLLWADTGGRSDDGYLTSADATFSSQGFAVVSDRIDLSTGADWLPVSSALGDARIQVASTDPSKDVFIGIARAGDVSPYLDGVERTVVRDVGSGSRASDQQLLPGSEPSGPPASQDFWTAQASGSGTQQLVWTPADGNWVLVVMNADGSANVSVRAAVGATVPALTGLAWGVLAGGIVLVAIAVVLLVVALRRPAPSHPQPPYSGAPGYGPSGPPPSWAPPAPTDRTTAADARPSPSTTNIPRSGPPSGPASG